MCVLSNHHIYIYIYIFRSTILFETHITITIVFIVVNSVNVCAAAARLCGADSGVHTSSLGHVLALGWISYQLRDSRLISSHCRREILFSLSILEHWQRRVRCDDNDIIWGAIPLIIEEKKKVFNFRIGGTSAT